jgi:hypothetical protein
MTLDWERIENFVGFGNQKPRVLFLGMEEGLARDADLLADLRLRSGYDSYMDLAEAQTQLVLTCESQRIYDTMRHESRCS